MSIRAIDIAYNCLQENKDGMTFNEIWSVIKTQLGYDDVVASKKISQFYTNLSLDGRFVSLENNVWNLKSHCKYDDVAVKEEDYADSEDEEEVEEDSEDMEDSYDENTENDY